MKTKIELVKEYVDKQLPKSLQESEWVVDEIKREDFGLNGLLESYSANKPDLPYVFNYTEILCVENNKVELYDFINPSKKDFIFFIHCSIWETDNAWVDRIKETVISKTICAVF